MKAVVLTLLCVIVYALHQDFWFWKSADLIFGILPIGLAYHAGYCFLSAILMFILVKFAWPSHLETIETPTGGNEAGKP